MKKIITYFVTSLCLTMCTSLKDEIAVNFQEKGAEVASSMYGIFFEEINHAGDGGLYAELVKNRSFEELEMPEGYRAEGDQLIPKPVINHESGRVNHGIFKWTTEPVPGWSIKSKKGSYAKMRLTKEKPMFTTAPNNLELVINDASEPISLINQGYWGMGIQKGEKYHFRAIIRPAAGYKGKIIVKVISEKGDLLASTNINAHNANQWNDVKAEFVAAATDAKATLALEFDAVGKFWIDYVSLFPEKTFKNRPNGLRNDVAGMLAGLKPAFVRWPGGCVVEGISLENRFEWKKTLGDPATRPGEYSTWGYRCSYGFGYYEMLQFCEDINAKAMYVCNVGLGCQFRMGDACPEDEIEYYIDDCLDAIEYALGDATTEWGAKRAAAGHPAPFPLQYVEIGNENWGEEYDKRFDIFYNAIKEKYPQLTLISNHGMGGIGKSTKTDMIDPHWYVNPDFFFRNTTIFDEHPRGKYTVYVGEYACNNGVGGGNMIAALSEAAFISGMERNGDLVTMASYAPLLENKNNREWSVNLIWLDTDEVVGRSSYYVQKMAAENKPDYNLKLNKTMSTPQPKKIEAGGFGFGSWATKAEFKDAKVTSEGKTTTFDLSQYLKQSGEWNLDNGIISQTSLLAPTRCLLKGYIGNNYTFEFKARKTDGAEGFFVYFGMTDDGKTGQFVNVGGWGNKTTAVQTVKNGNIAGTDGRSVGQTLEANKWYDVKLVGTPEKVEFYLDGALTLTYKPTLKPLQFFASGYDEKAGEMIFKVVNAENSPYQAKIKLDGAENISKIGKVISLTAKGEDEENSFENPKYIYPAESEYSGFGKSFEYDFPPFSYTIMRIKLKIKS